MVSMQAVSEGAASERVRGPRLVNPMQKSLQSKVVDAVHATLDSIVKHVEDRQLGEAMAATSVLAGIMSIDVFREIVERRRFMHRDGDPTGGHETDVDNSEPCLTDEEREVLETEAIRRGFYRTPVGLFSLGCRTVWARSTDEARRLLGDGQGEVVFLNTRLDDVLVPNPLGGGGVVQAHPSNPAPPEHLRYVGPLLPDGSIPQS